MLEPILACVEEELFGKVAEEKEAKAFVAGCKEGKRSRALDTYELAAAHVTFAVHFADVLRPVRLPGPPP